jgi:two-component system, sensor histidine kinase LadS
MVPIALAHASVPAPLLLDQRSQFQVELNANVVMLTVADRELRVRDAVDAFDRGDGQALPNIGANFGFDRRTLWFYARVSNTDHPAQDWLLTIEQPRLDEVDLYVRYADGTIDGIESGDARDFSARSLEHRFANFLVNIRQNSVVDLYWRVRSDSSIQVPAALYTRSALTEEAARTMLWVGIYYGVLLALLLYNLALYIAVGDRTYAYYIGYVSAVGVLLLSLNGIGFQHLWAQLPHVGNALLPMSIAMALTMTLGFVDALLDLKRYQPLTARIIRALMLLLLLMTALAVVGWHYELTLSLNYLVIICMLLASIAAVREALRGQRLAWVYLLSWLLVFGATIPLPMSSLGWLPQSFVTTYGVQFGTALQMVILSFILAHRIHLLKADLLEQTRRTNDELETRVATRTRDLNQTLKDLDGANRRLMELSQRDGLTNVPNRRFLDTELKRLHDECSEERVSMGLAIVDLDHFKAINDRFGHLVGDECLRLCAAIIARAAPVHGRFGGEEFVLAWCERSRTDVADQVLRVLNELRSVRSELTPPELSLAASAGLAWSADASVVTLDALLARADQQLYAAKAAGRGCLKIKNLTPTTSS